MGHKGEVKLRISYYHTLNDEVAVQTVAKDKATTFPHTIKWDVTYYEVPCYIRVQATDSEGNIAVSKPIKLTIQ